MAWSRILGTDLTKQDGSSSARHEMKSRYEFEVPDLLDVWIARIVATHPEVRSIAQTRGLDAAMSVILLVGVMPLLREATSEVAVANELMGELHDE